MLVHMCRQCTPLRLLQVLAQAQAQAVQNAYDTANVLAKAANVSVGALIYLSTSSSTAVPVAYSSAAVAAPSSSTSSVATPISIGPQTTSATVSATYALNGTNA